MVKIATLDVPKNELELIQKALKILRRDGVSFELLAIGQDVRTASIVLLNGRSSRALALWTRVRKWAPIESVTGIVLGAQRFGEVVAVDDSIERPLVVDDIVAALKQSQVRRKSRKVSKFVDDAAPLLAINRHHRARTSVSDEPLRLTGLVLVIDDSVTVRRHLKFVLSRFGLEVDTAESGEDGLMRAIEKQYDLIFLDIVMPGSDGFLICKRMKTDRRLRDSPIVMLTSKSSPFDKIRGALSGCDSYVTKPVELEFLQEILQQHLPDNSLLMSSEDADVATVVIEPVKLGGTKS